MFGNFISVAQVWSLKCSNRDSPSSPFDKEYDIKSWTVVSLYLGGLSSETNSSMGPYSFVDGIREVLKKHATDTRGPI